MAVMIHWSVRDTVSSISFDRRSISMYIGIVMNIVRVRASQTRLNIMITSLQTKLIISSREHL